VSVRRRSDGSMAVFPHFVLDRGKPGLIAVDGSGRRFANEAANYHDMGLAMRAAPHPWFFVCDSVFLKKYGLGMIRPGAHGLRAFLRDGYLMQAGTIPALAEQLGIDTESLATTVASNNRYAESGRDLEFGKGEDAYAKNLGDPAHKPNPCIGPIATPPFYAIRVHPGDFGTSRGILTDEAARALDRNGAPIPGLFACGNDMHSVMGGTYPGPGITLGPAMTFGYVAARQLALANRRASGGAASR
jgi:succinate dehydrogenase/fumarate reductase flavoprotein subunit